MSPLSSRRTATRRRVLGRELTVVLDRIGEQAADPLVATGRQVGPQDLAVERVGDADLPGIAFGFDVDEETRASRRSMHARPASATVVSSSTGSPTLTTSSAWRSASSRVPRRMPTSSVRRGDAASEPCNRQIPRSSVRDPDATAERISSRRNKALPSLVVRKAWTRGAVDRTSQHVDGEHGDVGDRQRRHLDALEQLVLPEHDDGLRGRLARAQRHHGEHAAVQDEVQQQRRRRVVEVVSVVDDEQQRPAVGVVEDRLGEVAQQVAAAL